MTIPSPTLLHFRFGRQSIPTSKDAAVSAAAWPAHYVSAQTELHTSMEQAGQLGESERQALVVRPGNLDLADELPVPGALGC